MFKTKWIILFIGISFLFSQFAYAQYYPAAEQIETDTSNFDTNLGSGDTTVQKALETLDELSLGGDITSVWGDLTGDVSALIAAGDDSFDAALASYSKPAVHSADCSGVTGIGRFCIDTDDGALYIGDGATAQQVGAESDTLQTVTGRGATTDQTLTMPKLVLSNAAATFDDITWSNAALTFQSTYAGVATDESVWFAAPAGQQ